MAEAFQDFAWKVEAEGYELTGHMLRPRTPSAPAKVYKPFRDQTGLFRMFAETQTDRDSVLAFAQRFGLLGVGLNDPDFPPGEPFKEWVTEIRELWPVLRLWDLARARDKKRLAKYVEWWADHQVVVRPPAPDRSERPGTKTELFQDDEAKRFQRGDLVQPALEYVRRVVTERLGELASAHVEWRPDSSGLRLSYAPKNLLGTIWLQFALAITQRKDFHTCRTCDNPFEVSRDPTTGRRLDSVFCSDACKSRDYRNRRREARRLHTRGVPLRKIATKLGTLASTVKKWVTAAEHIT